jgi:hypothetical protein
MPAGTLATVRRNGRPVRLVYGWRATDITVTVAARGDTAPARWWTERIDALALGAYVAEYERSSLGVLFRVVNVPVHGIVYVLRRNDGTLLAETFSGRSMREVPADARAAVEDYNDPAGKL